MQIIRFSVKGYAWPILKNATNKIWYKQLQSNTARRTESYGQYYFNLLRVSESIRKSFFRQYRQLEILQFVINSVVTNVFHISF